MSLEAAASRVNQIQSELVSYRGSDGRRIAAYIDTQGNKISERPWVLMSPKYGETKKNNLHLAYALVANGFNVLRFDMTRHVGESDGEMIDFTLPGAVEDIVASLDFIERRFSVDNVILVASSLSARCAFRAAATDPRVQRLVCVVGVVNLQHTLRSFYQEDIIGTFIAGRFWGSTDILGFNINGMSFCGTAVQANMHDYSGTVEDVSRIEIPVTYFHAEKDIWVDRDEVHRLFNSRQNCRLVELEGVMHEIQENPKVAQQMFRQVVRACQGLGDSDLDAVKLPDMRVVVAQNRRERDRLKRTLPPLISETSFWGDYLKHFELIGEADHYREYLELVGSLLGEIPQGSSVLDAGCGNGLFGLWMTLRYGRGSEAKDSPKIYVGLELTESGIQDAIQKHMGALWTDAVAGGQPPPLRGISSSFFRTDFDRIDPEVPGTSLPFADASFDKICCSLVISYLQHPDRLVAEFYRLLKPGGVLVLSSMKPYCDLSEIYRGFISQEGTEDDRDSARKLLGAAGKIKLKEETGNYTFFLAQELEEFALKAGFKNHECHIGLANQANVLKAVR